MEGCERPANLSLEAPVDDNLHGGEMNSSVDPHDSDDGVNVIPRWARPATVPSAYCSNGYSHV